MTTVVYNDAERREIEKRLSAELAHALPLVEAALKAAEAEVGPPPNGFGDSDYWARRREIMARLADELPVGVGAVINDRFDGCRVRIAGVTATCTAGLAGALRNWLAAARRRLEASR